MKYSSYLCGVKTYYYDNNDIYSEDDAIWDQHDADVVPYTYEELQARIDEGEAQFERGEYKSHEQLMSELQEEYSWLK